MIHNSNLRYELSNDKFILMPGWDMSVFFIRPSLEPTSKPPWWEMFLSTFSLYWLVVCMLGASQQRKKEIFRSCTSNDESSSCDSSSLPTFRVLEWWGASSKPSFGRLASIHLVWTLRRERGQWHLACCETKP